MDNFVLPYEMRPNLRLAYGVVAVGGKIPLLTKRDRRTGRDFYTLPGGTLDPVNDYEREDYEVCLEREIQEELGIRVRVEEGLSGLMLKGSEQKKRRNIFKLFFKCVHLEGEPTNNEPTEHLALTLATPDQAVELLDSNHPDLDMILPDEVRHAILQIGQD